LIANVLVALWSYSAGFLLNTASFPIYLKGASYISPWNYGFAAMAVNEFRDHKYDCPYDEGDPRCQSYDGNEVLKSLELRSPHIDSNLGYIAILAAATNLLALVALLLIKQRPK
jgi:hypothetical protein